jgi:acyl-CoA synthetase (AMP-forming)/AMP-acid ligase II
VVAVDLLDLLDRRDRPGTGLFWQGSRISWAEMWKTAGRVQAFVQVHGGSVAAVLSNHPAAPAVVVGAVAAGGTVASLPLPLRHEPLENYAARLAGICTAAGIDMIALADEFADMLPPIDGITVAGFTEMAAYTRTKAVDVSPGRCVQFTSGTSGAPRGVVLTTSQLGANVEATVAVIEPGDAWQVCSWLPLSHDMGLVGMLFIPWACGAGLHLRDPGEFLTDPLTWVDDLHATGAQVTAVPSFGLDMVLRRLGRDGGRNWDLSKLSTIIVGSEPIPVSSMARFSDRFAPFGLPPGALSPAYGMAETSLAVSMSPPGAPFRAATRQPDGTWSLVDGATCTDPEALVSCGPVLDGYRLEINDGRIFVDGPLVSDGYLGEPARVGPHDTRDEGFVVGGELVVVGRSDNMLFVRGRKLQPEVIEWACAAFARPGTAAAIADPEGTFTVVCEPLASDQVDRRAAATLRAAVSKACGIGPSRVVFLSRGATLKTTSGKVQRAATARWLAEDRLDVLGDHRTVRREDR